jgi:hypothetical protein
MDHTSGLKYGQKLRIPQLEQKYGEAIPFRVVENAIALL